MALFLTLAIEGIAQQVEISGQILEFRDRKGLEGISVGMEGEEAYTFTDSTGHFRLFTKSRGHHRLLIQGKDYLTQSYPLVVDTENINLGPVFLKRDLELEKFDNLVTLTEADLVDEARSESNSGLLRATRDVFLNRAAFDFSQAFFKVRGYDSRQGVVLINGILMNRNWDGRPQWNNWGGLNDATRNQEFSYGLEASEHTFGRLMGSTLIDMSPMRARPGLRFSIAGSNRTYRKRLMATYHSGLGNKGFAHSISLSRRWAEEGYVSGTPYDAYSIFLSSGFAISQDHSIGLSVVNAYNSRGRSAALTDEVASLAGPRYNPYWGWQENTRRPSRIRTIHEPIIMLNYDYAKEDLRLRIAAAYQTGSVRYTRTGYFDAPNPDPTYYRYLPSYSINSPIGANFIGANEAKNSFLQRPQWPWTSIYEANASPALEGKAAYAYFEDRNEENTFTTNAILNMPLGEVAKVDGGVTLQRSEMRGFAQVRDLMGARYLRDVDPFTNTRNDLNGVIEKELDEAFGYNYQIDTDHWTSFLQTRFFWKQWDFYVAGEYAEKSFQRDGFFLNERFPDHSFGKGESVNISFGGVKCGLTYGFNSRHWIKVHTYRGSRPPSLKNTYVNPRENHRVVPGLRTETAHSVDINYHLRMPHLKGRVSAYYTRIMHGTEVSFFYVDSGLGSYFVQEVSTGLDKLFRGVEMGLEYQISPTTKTSLVTSIGRHEYASDPELSINFDTTGAEGEMRQSAGNIDLGQAIIKWYRLPRGPQTALSLGIEYRDPSYWWVSATANYLANNYIDIAFIKRTGSFRTDPDTGNTFDAITEDRLRDMLRQDPLPPIYLLNLVGGKSWRHKGNYISAFFSINNLFDTVFKSGGYEQSRNGNYGQMYQDNLSGTPSFGPKYWYGFGRTFFLNLAISF